MFCSVVKVFSHHVNQECQRNLAPFIDGKRATSNFHGGFKILQQPLPMLRQIGRAEAELTWFIIW
jgi:hypothetical protein